MIILNFFFKYQKCSVIEATNVCEFPQKSSHKLWQILHYVIADRVNEKEDLSLKTFRSVQPLLHMQPTKQMGDRLNIAKKISPYIS